MFFIVAILDGRVLIVIGGDNHYGEEQDVACLSKWAWRKMYSQFTEEYMDGTKSFIFSWDKDHQSIHEEAMKFYLDKNRNPLEKFVPTPPPKVKPEPPKPHYLDEPKVPKKTKFDP